MDVGAFTSGDLIDHASSTTTCDGSVMASFRDYSHVKMKQRLIMINHEKKLSHVVDEA